MVSTGPTIAPGPVQAIVSNASTLAVPCRLPVPVIPSSQSSVSPSSPSAALTGAAGSRRVGPVRLYAVCACTAAILLALLVSGVTPSELARFVLFQLGYVLIPGLVLFALIAEQRRSLSAVLAVGWPLGFVAEIACFVLTASIGQRWLFTFYPAVLFGFAGPILWRRRHEMPAIRSWEASRTLECRGAITATLITVGVILIVYVAFFAPAPLPRANTSVSYYPDLVFQLSLAAEILHHWPFMSPSVAGQRLHYHIFANIDMAAAAQVMRLDLATVLMRLQPATFIGLIGVQLFALGRKVGGSRATGLMTLFIGMFAGELNFARISVFGGGDSVLALLYSPSYQLGAVFFLAIMLVLVDGLPSPGARSWRYWTTLGLLSLGATGAKSSVLPVVAGGLAVAAISRAIATRRPSFGGLRPLAVILAATAIGYLLIYRGGGQGVRLAPLDFVRYTVFAPFYHRASQSVLYAFLLGASAVAVLVGTTLLPLIGAVFVRPRWWTAASASSADRLLMCTFAASLLPFLMFGIPGDSEGYFLVYGFLAASAVSANGLVRLASEFQMRTNELKLPAVVFSVGVVIMIAVFWRVRSGLALLPGYALVVCVIALTIWLLRKPLREAAMGPVRSVAMATALLAVGLTVLAESFQLSNATLVSWLHGRSPSSWSLGRDFTPSLWRGLVWIKDHSRPSDVLAVNNHYLQGSNRSRYYDYSAFSQRRVVLESWDYTPQGYAYLAAGKTGTPFGRLLALNDQAVTDGSPGAVSSLYDRYGVRYIVIDRRDGAVPGGLLLVAKVVYANHDITVLRLASPRSVVRKAGPSA